MKDVRKRRTSPGKASPSSLAPPTAAPSTTIGTGIFDGHDTVEHIGNTLRSIIDAIPHAVLGLKERKVVFANRGAKAVFGWEPEELIGQSTRILYRTDADFEEIGRRFYTALADNQIYCEEYPCRHRDDRNIVCMVRADRIGEDLRRGAMVVVTYADITGRAQAAALLQQSHGDLERKVLARTEEIQREVDKQGQLAEALRKGEEKYRQLMETAQDCIIYSDLTGKILYTNTAFQKISGYSEKEILTLNLEDITSVKHIPLIRERLRKRMAGDDTLYLTEFEFFTKYRQIIPIEVTASLVKEQERPLGVLLIARNISERRVLEEALKESEGRYRHLFEGIEDPIIVSTFEDRFIDCNSAAIRHLGYSYEEFLNLHPETLVHPDYHELRKENIRKLEAGEIILAESVYRCKDGRIIPVEVNERVIDFRGRKIILSTARDISRRKEIERTLAESKERLELALEGGDLGIFSYNLQTKEFSASAHSWKTAGYESREHGLGIDAWMSIVHPDDLNRVIDTFKKLRTGESDTFAAEYRLRHKSGEWKWMLIKGKIIELDSRGIPLRAAGTHQDITQIKHAETALVESEEKCRKIIDLTSDVIWEIDGKERFTYISPRIEIITGHTPEDIVGKSLYDLVPEKDAEAIDSAFRILKKKYERFANLEHAMYCKDGRKVNFEVSGYPFFDESGKFCGYRGASRDVTKRMHAERELRMRDKELEVTNLSLQEANAALRVLLQQMENEKRENEEKIISNLNKLVLPYIVKLKLTKMNDYQVAYLDIVEKNITKIVSPFLRCVTHMHVNLTPREIQIVNHIKDGMTTKEIAAIMNVSPSAIELHRNHIRNKLGLNNKKINLYSYLISIDAQ